MVIDNYGEVADEDQFVADLKPTVHLSSSTVHDLGNVDAVVAGNVLVTRAASNTKAQTFASFGQFDLDDVSRAHRTPPSHILHMNNSFASTTVSHQQSSSI